MIHKSSELHTSTCTVNVAGENYTRESAMPGYKNITNDTNKSNTMRRYSQYSLHCPVIVNLLKEKYG